MIGIADSSGLISLFIQTDQDHKHAIVIRQALEHSSGTLYIPSEVFAETINIIGKKLNHQAAIKLAEGILAIPIFLLIDTPLNVRTSALERFNNAPQVVSFTDCLVMALADHLETKMIFGFDEVFSKNGYTRSWQA
jgi:predicted nucleic acid-binding protein